MQKERIKNCKEVLDIISSLISAGYISGLSHSRIFPDGSRAELWSHGEALEHTYVETNYTTQKHAPLLYKNEEENGFFLTDKISKFDEKSKKNYEMHLLEQRELFDLNDPFIIRGNDELCDEFFCFYGKSRAHNYRDFFIENPHYIKSFIKEYKIKAKKLIKLSEENRIVMPWINIHKNHIKLTPRENQIAQLITYDETNKQIAEKLNIGIRTVEGYVEKIKNKYTCDKKDELIKLLRMDGFLFL